jgi:tetratricopeptide (TPR) repeat protein
MSTSARRSTPIRWGEPGPSGLGRVVARIRALLGEDRPNERQALGSLPLALQRSAPAAPYLEAAASSDHQRAGAAALVAMEQAARSGEWWPADIWGHRALWHFEQAGMELAATRAARMIGELRTAAGDPASARRYYAEAISEARDIGAEREQGLAALGLGRAQLELGDVTTARRLAAIAIDLLTRADAPQAELDAARELRGQEKEVG